MSLSARSIIRSCPVQLCHRCFRSSASSASPSPPDPRRLLPSQIQSPEPPASQTGPGLEPGSSATATGATAAGITATNDSTTAASTTAGTSSTSATPAAAIITSPRKSIGILIKRVIVSTDDPRSYRGRFTPSFLIPLPKNDSNSTERKISDNKNAIDHKPNDSHTPPPPISNTRSIWNSPSIWNPPRSATVETPKTGPDDWAALDPTESAIAGAGDVDLPYGTWAGTLPTPAGRPDQGRKHTSLAFGHRQQPRDATGTDTGFRSSTTVVLKGVGNTLLEEDIRRIVRQKKHLTEFIGENDIERVIPYRDLKSLDLRPVYHITFKTKLVAERFVAFTTKIFSNPRRSHWPADIRFPPASRPEFVLLDERKGDVTEQQDLLQALLSAGGSVDAKYVVLSVSATGRGEMPRTSVIRQILREREVELVEKREVENVMRIRMGRQHPDGSFAPVRASGRSMGVEGKWLVRCKSESEAMRVVRELHMIPVWEGGSLIHAERVYA